MRHCDGFKVIDESKKGLVMFQKHRRVEDQLPNYNDSGTIKRKSDRMNRENEA